MPNRVALLRGINVGGHNKIAMADLRDVVVSLGHTDVATYIQSGNVVFSATDTDTSKLAAELEEAIADRLDVSPRAIVVDRDDLAKVIRDNPYPGEDNPRALHAVFFAGGAGPDIAAAVTEANRQAAERGSRDSATLVGGALYLHTPDGFGRSKLAEKLNRVAKGADGTARNWATLIKLLAMCDADQAQHN